MARGFVVLALLFALGFSMGSEAEKSRGVTLKLRASEARDAPVEAEIELYSKSYALVIGIDDYTAGWPRLGQAVKDARNVAKALEAQGFEVTLKTNDLEKAFKDFFIVNGADPDSRLFVWFAGHGHTDQKGEGYLIPIDGVLERNRVRFLRTALSLRRFGEFVRLAESKHVFTVFDSCFAGTIFSVARAAPPPQITRITTRPVRQFLTSGDAGQTVSDDGTFAKLFIEALQGERRADGNGDGYLTASEMGSFLDAKMSNYTNNRQTPRYGKLSSPEFDKGDFVFALGKSVASTPKHQPSAPSTGLTPEMIFWQSVQGSKEASDYEAYLSQFPNGIFAELARSRINTLKNEASASATTAMKTSPTREKRIPFSLSRNPRRTARAGGTGGTAFRAECSFGEVVVGIYGRSGSWIDQVGAFCKRAVYGALTGSSRKTSSHGGNGGSYFENRCPSGEVVVAFKGRSGSYMDRIEIGCAPLKDSGKNRGDPTYTDTPSGSMGGSPFEPYECRSNLVATGIHGKSGWYLDSFGLICR